MPMAPTQISQTVMGKHGFYRQFPIQSGISHIQCCFDQSFNYALILPRLSPCFVLFYPFLSNLPISLYFPSFLSLLFHAVSFLARPAHHSGSPAARRRSFPGGPVDSLRGLWTRFSWGRLLSLRLWALNTTIVNSNEATGEICFNQILL